MTGQLLRVTTTPYQSVRFSQSARLVSSDSVDLERRKAIARMKAFQLQHSSGAGSVSADYDFVNKINRTFSLQSSQNSTTPAPKSSNTAASVSSEAPDTAVSVSSDSSAVSGDAVQAAATAVSADTVSSYDAQQAVSTENNSAYTLERGAFEFRVSSGELSFLPSLTMTVMTQRPEVHFEYLGGHNYVPPEKFDDNGFMNLLA